MPEIEIDDEVLILLRGQQQRMRLASLNDVLRSILIEPQVSSSRNASAPLGGLGALKKYVDAGLVTPGRHLKHVKKRSGEVLWGVITPDGTILAEGVEFANPSPALGHLVGTSINGWEMWLYAPTGLTLNEQCDRKPKRRNRSRRGDGQWSSPDTGDSADFRTPPPE